jgi:membrane associated rhomboid family serine protease
MIPIRDTIQSRRFPLITYFLIVLNGIVFIYELGLSPEILNSVILKFGLIPARIMKPHFNVLMGFSSPGWISFLSSLFLHGSWLHVVGNMWSLFLFGDNVEDRLGHLRFLLFYVLCGVAAGLAHVIFHPASTLPTIGASGAIAGVMGAYFVLFPRSKIIVLFPILFYPLFLEVPAIFYLFIWFLTQIYSGAYALQQGQSNMGGIAFLAHAGGFLAGLFFLAFLLPRGKKKQRKWYGDEYYPW